MKLSRLKVGWLLIYHTLHPACVPMEGMVKSSFVGFRSKGGMTIPNTTSLGL